MKYDIGISNAIIVSSHNGYEPFIGSIGVKRDKDHMCHARRNRKRRM